MKTLNERRSSGADGANDGGTKKLAAIVEFDAFMRGGDGAAIQENGDARFFHFLAGEVAESGSDLGQDLVLRMDHGYDDIFFAEIAVKASAATNKLVQFARHFNPAEAGAHDDEMEKLAASLGIGGCFGVFQLTDDVLPKVDGIAHDLESESVLGHAWNDAEIAVRTTGKDQMVVVQVRPNAVALVIFNFGAGQVDSFHPLGTAANAG
jgi:hypothetical protein